jgi:hypothetical protein
VVGVEVLTDRAVHPKDFQVVQVVVEDILLLLRELPLPEFQVKEIQAHLDSPTMVVVAVALAVLAHKAGPQADQEVQARQVPLTEQITFMLEVGEDQHGRTLPTDAMVVQVAVAVVALIQRRTHQAKAVLQDLEVEMLVRTEALVVSRRKQMVVHM